MTLKLYNTKTRSKDEFAPIDPKNVRMYVCGPTVYDYAHIGNARPVIVFDVLFRLLRHVYGTEHVTYARNITDIEDKIIARAAKEGRTIRDLTEETAQVYLDDTTAVGALVPTLTPRATEHVDEMLKMIGILVEKGHAYEAEGHVLFDVTSMADYGNLSGRSVDDMIAGARVEVAPYKKNPMDFVLWKPSSNDEPGWDSAFGRGRPGWHIECSAMIEAHMGETIDIHAGGIDLVFPHHENEIAQSACTHGVPLANYWLHNGFLQVEGEKMSKSLGNFHTIHSLLADWPGEVLRLQMLQSHYRQPMDWTERAGKEAQGTLDRWYALTDGVEAAGEIPAGVLAALSDDINTPGAIAELHKLANAGDAAGLKAGAALLGFLEGTLSSWNETKLAVSSVDPAKVEALIEERTAARAAKDFAASDRIRDELKAMGVEIKDGPEGTSWTVAK